MARWAPFLALAAAACGDAEEPPIEGCEAPIAAEAPFSLAPGAPLTQIHANARFADGAVWLAYNAPRGDGSGSFDVFLTRVHCDGAVDAPVLVNAISRGNDVDPAVAVADDAILVAWQSDSGAAENNLDILYRTFDRGGVPIMDEDRVLETTRAGVPVPGNAWMPAVTGTADGHFAVAGGRAIEQAGTFQTFVQRIDIDGALLGEAMDAPPETGLTHSAQTIATDSDGALVVAWTRASGTDDVFTSRVPPGIANLTPPARATDAPESATPSWTGGNPAHLAFGATIDGDRQIVVEADGVSVELGAVGELDHSPAVAVGPGGGAVLWYRNISGFRNDVVVQHFAFDGATFTLAPERVIPTSPAAAPYGPAIAHAQDDIYFIAWSEGTSPDFVLRGRFIALSE